MGQGNQEAVYETNGFVGVCECCVAGSGRFCAEQRSDASTADSGDSTGIVATDCAVSQARYYGCAQDCTG